MDQVKLVLLLLLLSLACAVTMPAVGDLTVGFYNSTCPCAESIVRGVVEDRLRADPSVAAALLRLHFHDCFVRGCDASILIDSTKKKEKSEKTAGPNLTVRGFDIIAEAKKLLEAQCPSTVSCADIIAVATRDAVSLAGGPSYDVPTGRRDGLVSRASEVDLPSPSFTVPKTVQAFAAKGLTAEDMVTLLGGHTVGVAHCGFFQDRLSNFQGTGRPDPTMDPALRDRLSRVCGGAAANGGSEPTVFLDQNTSFVVDIQYYNQLQARRGIMQIDQELALHRSSAGFVSRFAADGELFHAKFAAAMVKMGSVEVLVGAAGEIRKNCNAVNKPPKAV